MTSALAALRARIAGADRGATAVEYALLVALIAAIVSVAAFALGGQISDIFHSVMNQI